MFQILKESLYVTFVQVQSSGRGGHTSTGRRGKVLSGLEVEPVRIVLGVVRIRIAWYLLTGSQHNLIGAFSGMQFVGLSRTVGFTFKSPQADPSHWSARSQRGDITMKPGGLPALEGPSPSKQA
jgi:hypothetical protein